MSVIDPAFGVNSFNTAKYYNETATTARNIMFILEGRHGCYPSMPTIGMDIKRELLYQDFDRIDCEGLKVDLVKQCSAFLTNVRDGSFDVQKAVYKGRPLLLFIIPITVDTAPQRLVIGTMLNSKGELTYRVEYAEEEPVI
jgi:hypothetical protein